MPGRDTYVGLTAAEDVDRVFGEVDATIEKTTLRNVLSRRA
ncbi:MAG: hypothetical protein AB8B71_03595 [Paracoccaceae bacterium]